MPYANSGAVCALTAHLHLLNLDAFALVRTINAAPNSKYFGVGKGVTSYNFTREEFTGFHGIFIPGTLRDSLFLLEGLLEQITSLRPIEIITDKINTDLIAFNWDDILRVAGSLKLGTVSASDLMRSLQRGNQHSTLSKAIAELGRIAKTLYLLSYIDDESYRQLHQYHIY